MKTRVAQFGLGPIGIETLKLAATKPWLDVVGGIDIDPRKANQDLGALTGLEGLRGCRTFRTLAELLERQKPEVILHTSVSQFRDAYQQMTPIVEQGISLVSSCEELVYPQLREPRLAAELHDLARRHHARVLGTGVNPGFVMDVLPLCLTTVSRGIRAIHIERIVNASTRREPLQRKIGSGQSPADVQARLDRGEAGHAGLRESLALVAHGLGWELDEIVESRKPVIAERAIRTAHFQVEAGQACGIDQRLEAKRAGLVCGTLHLQMYLDAAEPRDRIRIEGDPPLDLLLSGGVAGDAATVAVLVNSIPRLLQAPAGLLLGTDLSLPRYA